MDCEIKSGEKFRILFYKGGSNLTLYAEDGVNEFILKDALEEVAPNDYNEYLLACDEICLSGNNNAAPGEAVINDVYLETYDDEGQKVEATFESPTNTNTSWDATTNTFTWSTTYYNQLRNIVTSQATRNWWWTAKSSLVRSSVFFSTRAVLT